MQKAAAGDLPARKAFTEGFLLVLTSALWRHLPVAQANLRAASFHAIHSIRHRTFQLCPLS